MRGDEPAEALARLVQSPALDEAADLDRQPRVVATRRGTGGAGAPRAGAALGVAHGIVVVACGDVVTHSGITSGRQARLQFTADCAPRVDCGRSRTSTIARFRAMSLDLHTLRSLAMSMPTLSATVRSKRRASQPPRVYWNLSAPALYEEAVRRGEGVDRRRRPAGLPDRAAHRPLAERQVHRPRAVERSATSPGARSNRPMEPAHFDALQHDILASLDGRELFVQDCYARRRPAVPPAGPRHHRVRLAQPVRAQPVHRRSDRPRPSARRRGSPSSTRRASRPTRRATARDSDVVIALNFAQAAGAHRRHELRRRDQEVDLHAR